MVRSVLALVAFLLFVTTVYANNGYYVPITQPPGTSQNTQQMGSLQFRYITYTPTPSPSVLPTPGNGNNGGGGGTGGTGGTGSNAIANLAIRTMNTLRSSCGTYVSQRNVSCVRAASPKSVADRLALNVSQDYTLQCAGFAQAIAIGINAPIGDGNASVYVGRRIPGYQWISNSSSAIMVPGDIVVWNGAGCQHIAVVTQTYGSYAFTVAEANGGSGSIDFMRYGRTTFCSLQGWQHKL